MNYDDNDDDDGNTSCLEVQFSLISHIGVQNVYIPIIYLAILDLAISLWQGS